MLAVIVNVPVVICGLMLGLVRDTADAMDRNETSRPSGAGSRPSADDTAELLARCAVSDGTAFRRLYELHSARLYGIALRITRQPALASDAVHDAFLQVWRNAARFDPERGNAEGWLISLVRYRALDIARRQMREQPGHDIPEQADSDPDALSQLVAGSNGQALKTCLEQIDGSRRSLVVLSFIEGLTQSQVAERLGQPLGTVKSTIRRALLSLRSCLEQSSGDSGSFLGDVT